MLIRADPELMQHVARHCGQVCSDAETTGSRLAASWEALSSTWVGRGKAEAEGRYWATQRALRQQVAQLDALAQSLRRRSELIDEADRAVGLALSGPLVGSFDPVGNAIQWAAPVQPEALLPTETGPGVPLSGPEA